MRAIESEAEKAKRDPALLASFEALRLNLGTADTVRSVLLSVETWASIEGQAEPQGKAYWGVDLGTSAAQSAISSPTGLKPDGLNVWQLSLTNLACWSAGCAMVSTTCMYSVTGAVN